MMMQLIVWVDLNPAQTSTRENKGDKMGHQKWMMIWTQVHKKFIERVNTHLLDLHFLRPKHTESVSQINLKLGF